MKKEAEAITKEIALIPAEIRSWFKGKEGKFITIQRAGTSYSVIPQYQDSSFALLFTGSFVNKGAILDSYFVYKKGTYSTLDMIDSSPVNLDTETQKLTRNGYACTTATEITDTKPIMHLIAIKSSRGSLTPGN